jgi:hypothetical protein
MQVNDADCAEVQLLASGKTDWMAARLLSD